MPTPTTQPTETTYRNLLEHTTFTSGKPHIESILETNGNAFKRVTLQAGTELKCHTTDCAVTVVWLRGKAQFTASDNTYVMHPGSMLAMPRATPHGATAETDCVFLVIKSAGA